LGEQSAYRDLPLKEWDDVPDGHVARVDIDLVVRPHSSAEHRHSAELCQAPEPDASLEFFEECPAGSPTAELAEDGLPAQFGGFIVDGPFVVQRKGQQALVIVSGWSHSRKLPPGHAPEPPADSQTNADIEN
jgi:hypothetical protein